MSDRDERLAKVICPVCKREVSARVPHDGDGSALRPVWHKQGSVPCDGRFFDATDILTDGHPGRRALTRHHL